MSRQVRALAALAGLTCAGAWANPQSNTSSERESAVWAAHELQFVYTGFTTKYTCDALQQKMRKVLLMLGAGQDVEVRPFGCLRSIAPDLTTGVTIKMKVLQPAGAEPAPTVAAHWKRVDLLANRDPIDAAGDCELVGQIREQILPLFATRNVDYSSQCERGRILSAGTRLKADVLIADPSSTADAAAR